jgi:hypothetical protein
MKKSRTKSFTQPHFDRVLKTVLTLNWSNPDVYGDFLAQTYHHICHSTRLLAAAGSRFTTAQDQFHLQCMKHATEERSHEKLSLSDLKTIGRSLENFPELPATKALYRSAYYLIDRESPITLFGYAYFLECMGIAGAKVEAIVKPIYGVQSVKHLSLHANEDSEHIEAYESALDKLEGKDREHLEEAIASTAWNYERIYSEIATRAIVNENRKKAA